MAKFLDTQAISHELMKLIKEAKDRIILVSFSFKVNPQIQERLKTASKIGTLSEIVIVYGRAELKKSELDWLSEIQDLKIYEKSNLHAKCYLSEDRAIICSMNLYDYSQQNNIEMGILISRDQDKEAYEDLINEINNIKVNGIRKKVEELANKSGTGLVSTPEQSKSKDKPSNELTIEQRFVQKLLQNWRLRKSKEERTAIKSILSDEEITQLACQKFVDKNSLFQIVPKKVAVRFGAEILEEIRYVKSTYSVGKVTGVWYQSNDSKYDRVRLADIKTGQEKWYDTTQELPSKDKIVAVKLNNTWFNEYFYIEE